MSEPFPFGGLNRFLCNVCTFGSGACAPLARMPEVILAFSKEFRLGMEIATVPSLNHRSRTELKSQAA